MPKTNASSSTHEQCHQSGDSASIVAGAQVGAARHRRGRRGLRRALPAPAAVEFGIARVRLAGQFARAAAIATARSIRHWKKRVLRPCATGALPPWVETEALRRGDLLVDATASEIVADRHAEWLARGVHVVTANKLGSGGASHPCPRHRRRGAGIGCTLWRQRHGRRGAAAVAQPARAGGRWRPHPSRGRRAVRIAGMAVQPLRWRCARFPGSCARRARPDTPNRIHASTCPARTCAASC